MLESKIALIISILLSGLILIAPTNNGYNQGNSIVYSINNDIAIKNRTYCTDSLVRVYDSLLMVVNDRLDATIHLQNKTETKIKELNKNVRNDSRN